MLIKLMLFPSLLFAHASIKGIILNTDKEPLPLTNIVIVNKNAGTITDDRGRFLLENIAASDSVKISNIAYKAKAAAVKGLEQNDTILLTRSEIALDEIIVGDVSKYHQEQMLGFAGYAENGEFKLQPGSQLALYVANEKGLAGYIKGVSFQLTHTGKCRNSLRLRLLQLDTITALPAADILTQNILIQTASLKKLNYVDLSRYKIMLPYQGIVVLIEWVFPDTQCDRNAYSTIAANLSVPNNLVWLNFRDGVWKKSNRPRLPNGNFMTPNVGVMVGY